MTITVEVLSRIEPTLRWQPKEGSHTREFIRRKAAEFDCTEEALEPVLLEAHTILGRCVPPAEPSGADTGLVVGYVQSGKTLSFTTVISLARDNGYGLIILIAGTQVNLKSQSERRLIRDLGLDAEALRPWKHFENPGIPTAASLRNALVTWKSPTTPEARRRAVLITVLKQWKRLDDLASLLNSLRKQLVDIPVLLIDDEGDQASLNTYAKHNRKTGQSRTSRNYQKILDLKAAVPHHSFIQYTATPQAPLLLSLVDVLSPSFAELVTPGDGYVGGKVLFSRGSRFSVPIPRSDIPAPGVRVAAVPGSLLVALRLFLLGACASTVKDEAGCRSMMVHPSQQTLPHASYFGWVSDAMSEWKSLVQSPEGSPVRLEFENQFRDAYLELNKTAPELPDFRAIMSAMPFVLNATSVREINSTAVGKAPFKWSDSDYWILVGGQKLDRGFTVEGLTVTYMPRPLGTGNADTLQQRARFFGYKKEYLGYVRVFLPQDVADTFAAYVEHEEYVRESLAKQRGQPLAEWRRQFILDTRLHPTRANVIGVDIEQFEIRGWHYPSAPFTNVTAVDGNRRALTAFVERLRSSYQEQYAADHDKYRDRRAGGRDRNRLFDGTPLKVIVDEFLSDFRAAEADDSVEHAGLVLALNDMIAKNPTTCCSVFLIDDLKPQNRSITRGALNQPFSGKTPNTSDDSKIVYVGDRALLDDDKVTIHLRAFNMKDDPGPGHARNDVPWYGVHLPASFGQGVVIERE